MAEGAAAANQGNSFVAELEASNLHPLWDRYQRITPIKPQPQGRAVPLALARHRAVPAPRRRRGLDQRHRTPRADHGASGLRRRNDDHQHVARRLHRAGAGRPRPPASPHRRGHPLRHPRGRRGNHRQWPALRDEGRRPHPHPADVLARPHQRERPPHHLVRRRQHAADPRGRRPFLRAGRPAQQRVLAGRRRRGGAVDRGRPARRGRDRERGRIRRNTAIPARRRAGCLPPRPPAPTACA